MAFNKVQKETSFMRSSAGTEPAAAVPPASDRLQRNIQGFEVVRDKFIPIGITFPFLSDKTRFGYFFRVVPSDYYQVVIFLQLYFYIDDRSKVQINFRGV